MKLFFEVFNILPSFFKKRSLKFIILLLSASFFETLGIGLVIPVIEFISDIECNLLDNNSHIWRPFAPLSKIQVDINKPGWQWEGHGYFDANFGSSALEQDFSYWTWGRFPTKEGSYTFYDATPRREKNVNIALLFKKNGKDLYS